MVRRAVVLLSGGMDSATCLSIAAAESDAVFALTFSYGQRHSLELKAAERLGNRMNVAVHRFFDLDPRFFGGSALTDDVDVPKSREMDGSIPVTYVPFRNAVFLSIATAWAESLGAGAVYLGANAIDYSGYPDCRPEFVDAFRRLVELGTRAGVSGEGIEIRAPLLSLSKAEIVLKGVELGVDFALTISCYDPVLGMACGECDACVLRRQGFASAGVPDPTLYTP